jgi:hypothetical protein
MTAAKRLGRPRPAEVEVGAGGLPVAFGSSQVDSILEDWLVEDRWWTERPVRRRYLELVLESGRCVMVFRDLTSGRWYVQRG